ncbi:hypothetical protein [Falsiroseomonas ponticola]|uniref:hypothetical protein n=1 Tax=Falsiroseomonas ponticola TaxID=2786951 RepID=UPI001932F50C|nr:hypothetical protein [Roseomonas ponticola]
MQGRTRVATILLVVTLPLIPLVGGLAAESTPRSLVLLLLIAITAGAFVFVLAGDTTADTPLTRRPTTREAALGVLQTMGVASALAVVLILLVLWIKAGEGHGIDWKKLPLTQYAAVAFFAGAVGFGELIARYRDDPARLLGMRPSAAYICVNVASGILALALVQEFNAIADTNPNRRVMETLLAAFGAIAFFRTSLFTARVGDTDVGIGPSTMLKAFLDGTDRQVNRTQATDRADAVLACMKDVDFAKARTALPALCLGLVEGLTAEEQRALGEQIARLNEDRQMESAAKPHILGVYLLRVVGGTVLRKAVETLGPTIQRSEVAWTPAEPADPPE